MQKILYLRPCTKNKEVTMETSEQAVTRVTTIRETVLLDKNTTIPVRASFHPAGLRELAKLSPITVLRLGMYLPTLLISRLDKNIVVVSQQKLAQELSLSTKSIYTGLKILEEHKFIVKVGKGYYISPKLAWFGDQLDWAIELRKLKDLRELTLEYYKEGEPLETFTIKSSKLAGLL